MKNSRVFLWTPLLLHVIHGTHYLPFVLDDHMVSMIDLTTNTDSGLHRLVTSVYDLSRACAHVSPSDRFVGWIAASTNHQSHSLDYHWRRASVLEMAVKLCTTPYEPLKQVVDPRQCLEPTQDTLKDSFHYLLDLPLCPEHQESSGEVLFRLDAEILGLSNSSPRHLRMPNALTREQVQHVITHFCQDFDFSWSDCVQLRQYLVQQYYPALGSTDDPVHHTLPRAKLEKQFMLEIILPEETESMMPKEMRESKFTVGHAHENANANTVENAITENANATANTTENANANENVFERKLKHAQKSATVIEVEEISLSWTIIGVLLSISIGIFLTFAETKEHTKEIDNTSIPSKAQKSIQTSLPIPLVCQKIDWISALMTIHSQFLLKHLPALYSIQQAIDHETHPVIIPSTSPHKHKRKKSLSYAA